MICRITHTTEKGRARAGFTMIELIVVILILGIAAALVVPQLASSNDFVAQGAARVVVADLLHAQNDAIAAQATRSVAFDTANQSYQVLDENSLLMPAPWLGGDHEVEFGNNGRFSNVAIAATSFAANTVSFDALGTPSEGGTVDLTLGDITYRITVTAFTGRVTVNQVGG